MAETFRYTLQKPARTLYSSICVASAPRGVVGAVPKFSGTFGIEQVDFDAVVPIMVNAIKSETGGFSGPGDYYLACMSGVTAGKRAIQKGELDAMGKPADEALKIMEKANSRAEMYKPYAGIITAASKFPIELAKLENGRIIDIPDEEIARAQAAKDLFYPGAWTVPALAFKGFRPKSIDAKAGCTAFLQNCLFVKKGERISTGGGASNNDVFGGYAGYSDFNPIEGVTNEDMQGMTSKQEEVPAF